MKRYLLVLICLIFSIILMLGFVACDGEYFTVSYLTDGNGSIDGASIQKIKEGDNSKEVVALANEGYRFISWSDGLTDNKRMDKSINSDLTVYAIFEKIEIEIKYQAYGGGYIEGETAQKIKFGEDAEPVIAIPDPGYKFGGWSDGIMEATRHDCNVKTDISIDAVFYIKVEFEILFVADIGGRIEGDEKQKIELGADSSYVTAVPNENYEFVEWSDGEKNATRNLSNIQERSKVTAYFKRVKQNYSYVYNEATSNTDVKSVIISLDNMELAKLTIPKRTGYDFAGWYLEWHLTTLVGDTEGNLMIGKELFDSDSDCLYAKWVTKDAPHYKILMINVTNFKANFQTYEGQTIQVDYQQTEPEKRVHDQAAKFLANYLNAMFNGAVVVDVITTDTTLPLNENNFGIGYSQNFLEYYIDGSQIPEVKYVIEKFDSVITTVNLDDYYSKLHQSGGSTNHRGKFACVYADSVWGAYTRNGYPVEYILDTKRNDYESSWVDHMGFYIHEFVHTVELQVGGLYDYHAATTYYSDMIGGMRYEIEVAKLYLTNRLEINGKLVGVPASYWKQKNNEYK